MLVLNFTHVFVQTLDVEWMGAVFFIPDPFHVKIKTQITNKESSHTFSIFLKS